MPCTWNNGPPWRDLAGILSSRCNTSRDEDRELSPWKPGLGQGMVEYWNVGFKGSFSFIDFLVNIVLPTNHCPSLPEPIIPVFHCSNIPIVPARHRSRSGEAGGSEAN